MRPAALLVAATLAALAAPAVRTVAAQEPDTVSATPADTVPPAPTRPEYVPPRYAISVVGGRPGAGTAQEQPVLAIRFDETGTVADSSLLQRTLEADGGFQVAASAIVSLTPRWAVRMGAGAGRLTLRPRYDGGDSTFAAATSTLTETESGEVSLFFLEGALRMRLKTRVRPQPYLEVGASSVRWTADEPPAGAAELADGVTRFAALAAVGVLIPVNQRISARIHVETRAFRTPLGPRPAGSDGPAVDSMSLTFLAPDADRFSDNAQALYSTTRLDVGVSFGFGAMPRSPATPATPADPTPATTPRS